MIITIHTPYTSFFFSCATFLHFLFSQNLSQKDKEYPGEIQVNWKYQDKKRKLVETAPTLNISKINTPTLSVPATAEYTGIDSSSLSSARDSPVRSRDTSPKRKRDKDGGQSSRRANKDRDSKGTRTKEVPMSVPEETKPACIEEVYEVGDELGSGAFSIVKAGKHRKTAQQVAIKILDNYGNLENGIIFF